eukprot:m.254393 g.254393  ORF g.254393 m.254393 type:complete len:727 (-) comp18927_c0_seq1:129-2309(-)
MRLPACALLALAVCCAAFKPNEQYGHGFITRQAAVRSGLNFCPNSIDSVVEGNLDTDLGWEFFQTEAHCDDEHLKECSARIMILRSNAVLTLNSASALGTSSDVRDFVWTYIGRALHTLQDFYAHSNWVELGNNDTNPVIGLRIFENNPDKSTRVCADDHATLVSNTLTTGYFSFSLKESDACDNDIPLGKCRHGESVLYIDCPDGLNKDDPSRPRFLQAQSLAILATAQFLRDTHDLLDSSEAREALLGNCGPLPTTAPIFYVAPNAISSPGSQCNGAAGGCSCWNTTFVVPWWESGFTITGTANDTEFGSNATIQITLSGPNGTFTPANLSKSRGLFTGSFEVELDDLEPGEYTLAVCTTNTDQSLSIIATAVTPFEIGNFAFTAPGGRAQTPSPLRTQPVRGSHNPFTMQLMFHQGVSGFVANGSLSNLTAVFKTLDGTTLVTSPLNWTISGDGTFAVLTSIDTVEVPDENFIVYLYGSYNNSAFQLCRDNIILPQTFYVTLAPRNPTNIALMPYESTAMLPLNTTSILPLNVTSANNVTTEFTVTLTTRKTPSSTNGLESVTVVLPPPTTIAPNQSVIVNISITPINGLAHFSYVALLAIIQDVNAPFMANTLPLDLLFVGCADCPETIGSCSERVRNGTSSFVCTCHIGVEDDRCQGENSDLIDAIAGLATGGDGGDSRLPAVGIVFIAIAAVLGLVLYTLLFIFLSRRRSNPTNTAPAAP